MKKKTNKRVQFYLSFFLFFFEVFLQNSEQNLRHSSPCFVFPPVLALLRVNISIVTSVSTGKELPC